MKFDYVIVGAGFTGCVLAERIASEKKKNVLLIEKRNHIGGNCYDFYNEDGILVHKYGPHYFRTNSKEVFDYLSQFTKWNYLFYRVRTMVDGKIVPLPINLDTINELMGTSFSSSELEDYLNSKKIKIDPIKNSEDVILAKVGTEIYEKFYKNYTIKQWGIPPSELDSSVCARIPIRMNRDDRYFNSKYQAMPKLGYSTLFKNMLNNTHIHILMQTDYKSVKDIIKYDKLIYTGPIDEFFDYKYGKLPYRSLKFEFETIDKEFYQDFSQINYPNDYDFTRIVEIKHVTGQKHPKTTIAREYPTSEGEPYYPIPRTQNELLYKKYYNEAEKLENINFLGRLAEYKYLNMDEVVQNALNYFNSNII